MPSNEDAADSELVKQQFARSDQDGSDIIRRDELCKVLQLLDGSVWTEASCNQLLGSMGKSKEGQISYKEFVDFLFQSVDAGEAAAAPKVGEESEKDKAVDEKEDNENAKGKEEERNLGPFETPYGSDLAECVAERLSSGRPLVNDHRDYCGMGLQFQESQFGMGETMDGWCVPQTTWATKEEFVSWLSGQSDATLHGEGSNAGNQRITRARILGWLPDEVVARLASSDALVAEWAKALAAKKAAKAEADAKRAAEEAAAKLAAEEQRKAAAAAAAEKKEQELEAGLATDDAKLEGMDKKEIISLIRQYEAPDSELLKANVRVMMSPSATKEEVIALWKQVQAKARSQND